MIEAQSIRKCITTLAGSRFNSAVTITKPKTHPFRIVQLTDENRVEAGVFSMDGKSILTVERSQDWPQVYEGSPACRATKTAFFLKAFDLDQSDDILAGYQGKTYDPESCTGVEITPFEAIDVDSEEDFTVASALFSMRHGQ
jgi:CMP-N-acetylneuraminic acid synthetase